MIPLDEHKSAARRGLRTLPGRRRLRSTVQAILDAGQNVLLVGPPDVGKSALIATLRLPGIMVIDPFERIHSHVAARILRAMDRGTICIAAATTLDRARLGAVRRIAWRFSVVRVPPLTLRSMRPLLLGACEAAGMPPATATRPWTDGALKLAAGRPGVALVMAAAAGRIWHAQHALPSPAALYIEARVVAFNATP